MLFYPAIAKQVDDGGSGRGEFQRPSTRARGRVLDDVENLSPKDEPSFNGASPCAEAAVITHHVEEEEDEVFPKFPQVDEHSGTRRLGKKFTAAKKSMPRLNSQDQSPS